MWMAEDIEKKVSNFRKEMQGRFDQLESEASTLRQQMCSRVDTINGVIQLIKSDIESEINM